tara:strand:+ start:373 stop:1230 length:858 start_codon:yes stop_codon:yes gene_type:complete
MNYETFQPSFSIEEISPDYARQILNNKNNSNRTIRKPNVARLVTAIENGEWQITNQGIAFDSNGNLLDGQHRLEAIIKTGKTLKIMVARNMKPAIFNAVDVGAARSAGDILYIAGCSNSSKIAAGIKVYIFYKKYPSGNWSNITRPSHLQVLEVYKKEEETWSEINRRVSIFYKKFHFLNLSVSIPLYKLLLEKGYKEQVINIFFNQFSEGSNLDIDNPMLSLRNQMMQKAFRNRGSSNQRYLLNALISLFNMYINNEKRTSFRAPASDISDVLKIQDPLPCHIA